MFIFWITVFINIELVWKVKVLVGKALRKHYKDHLKVTERILKFYNEKQKTALSKEKNAFIFFYFTRPNQHAIPYFFAYG